jgi:hypothetical protein
MRFIWRIAASRGTLAAFAVSAAVVALVLPGSALAVQCGYKLSPPYGVSYGQINVPSAPGTYNAYYSFWSSPDAYYARRIRPDGSYAYEVLYSSGGQHDFANSVDVERRTQLKNNDGLSGWSYWVQANSLTSC